MSKLTSICLLSCLALFISSSPHLLDLAHAETSGSASEESSETPKARPKKGKKGKKGKKKRKRRKQKRSAERERQSDTTPKRELRFAKPDLIHLSGALSLSRVANHDVLGGKRVEGANTYTLETVISPRVGYMVTPHFELAGILEVQLSSTESESGDALRDETGVAALIDPTYYFSVTPSLHPYVHTALGYKHQSVTVGEGAESSFGGLAVRPGLGLAFTHKRLRSGKYVIRLGADFQYDRLSGDRNAGLDQFKLRFGFDLGLIL